MNSRTKAELKEHLAAIAEILYRESDGEDLKTLYGIEKSVRALAQKHVLPEIGIFLSNVQPSQAPEKLEF